MIGIKGVLMLILYNNIFLSYFFNIKIILKSIIIFVLKNPKKKKFKSIIPTKNNFYFKIQ